MTRPLDTQTKAQLTIDVVSTESAWRELEADWNRLLPLSEQDQIFISFPWLQCWWEAFGKDKQLCILVVRNENTVASIVPLMIVEQSRFGRLPKTISFIGAPEADYAGLVGQASPVIVDAVVQYLVDHRDLWDKMELAQIPEEMHLFRHLMEALSSHGLSTRSRHTDECPGFRFEGDPSTRKTFTFRKGHETRRLLNYFKGEGGLTVVRLDSLVSIRAGIDELMHLHITRWNDTPTPSQFRDERFRVFFHSLLDHLHPTGQICFFCTRRGETPVAMSFSYEYKGTIFQYTLAYNPFYTRKSPGSLHVILQSEKLVQDGFDIDFSRGAGSYKKLLANFQRTNMQIIVYGSGLSRRISDWWEQGKATSIGRRLISNRQIMELKMRFQRRIAQHGFVRFPIWIARAALRRVIRIDSISTYRCGRSQFSTQSSLEVRPSDSASADLIASFLGLPMESTEFAQLKKETEAVGRNWIVTERSMVGVARRDSSPENSGRISDIHISPIADQRSVIQAIVAKELDSNNNEECFLDIPSGSQLADVVEGLGAERTKTSRSVAILGHHLN